MFLDPYSYYKIFQIGSEKLGDSERTTNSIAGAKYQCSYYSLLLQTSLEVTLQISLWLNYKQL